MLRTIYIPPFITTYIGIYAQYQVINVLDNLLPTNKRSFQQPTSLWVVSATNTATLGGTTTCSSSATSQEAVSPIMPLVGFWWRIVTCLLALDWKWSIGEGDEFLVQFSVESTLPCFDLKTRAVSFMRPQLTWNGKIITTPTHPLHNLHNGCSCCIG